MGTLAAVIALLSALAITLFPTGTLGAVIAFVALLLGVVLASLMRARPGYAGSACILGCFALVSASPFALTRREASSLAGAAENGDVEAQALLHFYSAVQPFQGAALAAVTLLFVGAFVWRVLRAPEGAPSFLFLESEALARVATRVGYAAAFLFGPLIAIIVYDVLQRKYLDLDPAFTNTFWYGLFTSTRLQEMQWHLHAALFLLCLGYAYVRDSHVRIELVREHLKPRWRLWIELAGSLIFLAPFCYVVIAHGAESAIRSFVMMEGSAAQTGLPHRFVVKSLLPAGFALLAIAGLAVALRCMAELIGRGRSLHPGQEERDTLIKSPASQ